MQEANSKHRDLTDTIVTPLKGLLIMAGSVFAIIAAVATPVLGEAFFAVLFYGKSTKKAFGKRME